VSLPVPNPPELQLQAVLQQRILHTLFGMVSAVCALAVVAGLLINWRLPARVGVLILLGYATLALVAGAATRLSPARSVRLLPWVMLGSLGLVGGVGMVSGWGLQTPGLLFFGLAICLANALGTPRFGLLSAGLALLVVGLLGTGEQLGWLPAPGAVAPFPGRLMMPLAVTVTGALVGRTLATLLRTHLAAAQAREQRFRALLAIAATAYWELDADLQLTQLSRRNAAGDFVPVPARLGLPPWAVPALRFEPQALAQLRTDLAARVALRDLALRWQPESGRVRHCLASGEPRFDAQGRFQGYWGVVRDVSAEHRAREALATTETRYRDLFQQIPTPLTLHQGGRVIDANPAAARLLGYDAVAQMLGQDMVDRHVIEVDRAAVRAQIAALEAAPLGQTLPVTDMDLLTCQGQRVHIQTVGARSLHDGRPAMLSLSIDETGRRVAAREANRSQLLLSRVVALSPDVITLTDLHTGCYVMVNDSFTRLTGYSREDAVGRTALALGLWRNVADRDRVVSAILAQGRVQDQPVDFVGKQGQVISMLVSGTRFDNGSQSYLLLNSRDISETARVRLEREAILANASVGIAFTRDRRFVLANAQFERLYGWPEGTLVGQPGHVVWASDEDYEALAHEVGPALSRGEVVDVERQAQRRDGSPFLIRMRAKAIDPARPADSGTIWITEDVTAARQAEQDLARARDEAEAANRAKSAFLANTSHEIRTPLNGLQGLAWLARQPGVPPQRLQQYLDQIGDSADLLATIITDILDVAKIEAGKLLLEAEPFDLGALLQSLRQAYAALAAAQGLAFEAQFDPALPAWVRGDALRVRQILVNFLHNALKFTTTGGVRLVARGLPGGLLRFEVHDTGPGIAEATQARLFRPFTQADESTTRRHGGTGLGLSICRELARLMGGQVGLSSQVGRGSCFHAELPLPALAHPGPAGGLPGAGASAGDARLRGLRVLLVEDNSVNMMIGVALLEHWGMLVSQASDGGQALAAVAEAAAAGCPIDAVLMDLQMPGISGYETTAALRRQYNARQLPVIALTAAALVSEREQAAVVGMNDFLTKPIDPQRLHDALLRALHGAVSPA